MLETFARFILDLLMPASQLWILITVIAILFLARQMVWLKRVSVLFFVLLLVYSTPFLPQYLAYQLERQYPVWSPDEQTLAIEEPIPVMVLTAGITADTTLHASHQLSSSTFPRLIEGMRVYHTLKRWGLEPKLVLSGGANEGVPVTEAHAQALAAVDLGADSEDLFLHDPPGIINTCTEARVFAERFGEGQHVIVATSALHIPRAMWWFRYHGLEPTAAPANFRVRKDSYRKSFSWKPSYQNITLMERILKERVGMIWAQMSSC
jgi:uncharacterized SAM-binding protein YcdF (DUF218 family)